MKKLGIWISACRLRTLPLSISGAIVGSGIAYSRGFFNEYIFSTNFNNLFNELQIEFFLSSKHIFLGSVILCVSQFDWILLYF